MDKSDSGQLGEEVRTAGGEYIETTNLSKEQKKNIERSG
jgi:hypothetical protein